MPSLRISLPRQSSRLSPHHIKSKPIESIEQIITQQPAVSRFHQSSLQEFANSMETIDQVDTWLINTQVTMKELESPNSTINRKTEPDYHRMAIARYNQIFKVLCFLKHHWPNKTIPHIP